MHSWLITWRTYGTWLPGQPGFVGYFRPPEGRRRIDNQFNTATAEAMPHLERYASDRLKTAAVRLDFGQAERVCDQVRETCGIRGWSPLALAVLDDHVHVVLVTPDVVTGTDLLRDLKSYCSQVLNRSNGGPTRWWAERGSTRRLIGDTAQSRAIAYVLGQANPLCLWAAQEAAASAGPMEEPPASAGRVEIQTPGRLTPAVPGRSHPAG